MTKNIRITQIDGKLPNLALMKLSAYHKSCNDNIYYSRNNTPELFERQDYDIVYASCLFTFSRKRLEIFLKNFPDAIVGGTGSQNVITVEQQLNIQEYENYDYSIYPKFKASIGYTQRGCRFKCPFCIVPKKEGKPKSVNTIYDIWRGEPFPKEIHLLDNDFFGQISWQDRIAELREGKFKVCFNQGINLRKLTDEQAEALASVRFFDDQFKKRRLYTAWDNLGDEKVFFRGLRKLSDRGIPARHLMVYMLFGYRPDETWEDRLYRFMRIAATGAKPYPMIYNRENNIELREFQRWAIRRYYQVVGWDDYATTRLGRYWREQNTNQPGSAGSFIMR